MHKSVLCISYITEIIIPTLNNFLSLPVSLSEKNKNKTKLFSTYFGRNTYVHYDPSIFCFPVPCFSRPAGALTWISSERVPRNLLFPVLNPKLSEGSKTSFSKHLIQWDFEWLVVSIALSLFHSTVCQFHSAPALKLLRSRSRNFAVKAVRHSTPRNPDKLEG